MKVLLIGSGGREHALAWALAQSSGCEKLFCAPGNAGIAEFCDIVNIAAENVEELVEFAKTQSLDLVVVGPEAPLVLGLADRLKEENIPVFGPSQEAARLEGSKAFTKELCDKYNIPTAKYGRFTDFGSAEKFINEQGAPIVVKADGLAAGKGVIICQNVGEAIDAARDMLEGGAFGDAGAEIVIEEFLEGEELSYFALADGETVLPLSSAQDHKRAFDGDKGPNTGGMGAYSPAHMMTPDLERKIIDRIIKPTIDGMASDGRPFTGVLFAGLMVNQDGYPYLIEHNVRFGDPECQTLMMRLQGDLLEILNAAAHGKLASIKENVSWSENYAMCVVMATEGYPGSYPKNTPINSVAGVLEIDNTVLFHAGTARNDNDDLVSTGGRVFGVTSYGVNIGHARRLAYEACERIDWPDGFYRSDIGWRAIED